MYSLISFIILIISIFIFRNIYKKTLILPNIINFIWITVIIFNLIKFGDHFNLIFITLGVLILNFSIIISYRAPKENSYRISINKKKIIILVCILFFIELVSLYITTVNILSIAGSWSVILKDSTSIRYILLSRDDIPNLLTSISKNIFSFSKMTLVILVGILSSSSSIKPKTKFLFLIIFIGILAYGSFINFSKLAFVIDVLIIAIIIVILNIDRISFKSVFKYLIILSMIMVSFFTVISIQRSYGGSNTFIGAIKTTIDNSLEYFSGPTNAFVKLISSSFDEFSYGARFFRPIIKWFISFNIIDKNVLPPFFDYPIGYYLEGAGDFNVYTLFGFVYRDFYFFGYLLILVPMGIIFGYILSINKNTFFVLTLKSFVIYILLFSFYNFMVQETFYILYPIFAIFLDKLLIRKYIYKPDKIIINT